MCLLREAKRSSSEGGGGCGAGAFCLSLALGGMDFLAGQTEEGKVCGCEERCRLSFGFDYTRLLFQVRFPAGRIWPN